jgi:aminotransferase in exopolysaccharide biosynthesis
MSKYTEIIEFIKSQYPNKELIPLHEPNFSGREKQYVLETIESTFVSSVGAYVDKFEIMMAEMTKTQKAVAIVNGTSALQVALRLSGVCSGDEVLTQALTFIATINAIIYNGSSPVFLDVDLDTMGLSSISVNAFLEEYGELRDGICYNKKTNKKISACLPMHTFGFPVHLDELIKICNKWNIPIVEDAAESIGSEYKGSPTGSIGKLGVFSFNGNKIVTSGGGGAIVTNDFQLAIKAKHLTTTAKVPHLYEYVHDDIGYNFRMPNLNAALACAQLEQLNSFVENKRKLAIEYSNFFESLGINFRTELPKTKANYWLMCIELDNKKDRDNFLKETNDKKVMTRPIWQLIFKSPLYSSFQRDSQENAIYLENTIINIPSSVRK